MVLVLRPMTDATVLAAAGLTPTTVLFAWHLHVFPLPETVDSLVVNRPLPTDEHLVNPLRTMSWPLSGQLTHFAKQLGLIGGAA